MKPIYEVETVRTHDDYSTIVIYFRYPHRLPEVQWMVAEEVMHEPSTTYKMSGQVVKSSRSQFFKLGDTIYQEGDRGVGIFSTRGEIIELRPEQLEIIIKTDSGKEETILYGELPIMTQRDLLSERFFDEQRFSNYLLDKMDDFAEDIRKIFFASVEAKLDPDVLSELEGLLNEIGRG